MKVRERKGKMTNTFEQLKMEFSVDKKTDVKERKCIKYRNVFNIVEQYI